jgi:hypothetical protein
MGNIICCCKQNTNTETHLLQSHLLQSHLLQSHLLQSHKYCNNCEKNFLFNEYYKHIPECNRISRERYSKNGYI